MSRTPVPNDLIHRPEEVKRNAERFDDLCRLAEEVAFPVVREALVLETAATGAEALTDEVNYALETLAEDAADLKDFDQRQFLCQVQTSLRGAIPPPDEEECRQHSRELSQVLISTWLESLRHAQAKANLLLLSDCLLVESPLVESPLNWLSRFFERLGARRAKLPQTLNDAFASFALNESDATTIMSTLRLKLFPKPCLVALPFDLALVGAPGMPVLAMTRPYYERLLEEIKRQLEKMEETRRIIVEQRARELVTQRSEPESPIFSSAYAQSAADSLSEPLPAARYGYLAKAASANPPTASVETRAQYALTIR